MLSFANWLLAFLEAYTLHYSQAPVSNLNYKISQLSPNCCFICSVQT